LYDKAMLETLYDGLDLEDFKAMMKDLYDKSEELIANINKAMDEKDAKGLFSFGHDLKGMTGNFGMSGLAQLATAIESGGRAENPDMDEIKKHVDQLQAVYDEMHGILLAWLPMD